MWARKNSLSYAGKPEDEPAAYGKVFLPDANPTTELRHNLHNRRIQDKRAALVKNHRHRGRRDNLGEGGQVEKRINGDWRRIRLISKPPQ